MKTPVFQAVKALDYGLIRNISGNSMARPHYHDGYEIYLQLKGEREIFFQHDKYKLQSGTLCIIYPYIFHSISSINSNEEYSRYILNFSDRIFNSFLMSKEIDNIFNELSSCIMNLNEDNIKTVIQHMENINKYWTMQLNGINRGKKLAYIEVYRLLDSISQMAEHDTKILNETGAAKISDSEIYSVLLYIDNHYKDDICVKDMMELAHMSKSNFYKCFKNITGNSFGHYLNRLRISKAHELLSHTSLPLHKIAESTGFASTAHMTRIFKEVHGISPSAYRRN